MRKLFLAFVLLFALISTLEVRAQRHEIGPFVGTNYYLGDLIPTVFGLPSYNFGVLYRYDFNDRISARVGAHYGYLYGDSKLNKPNLRYKNLDFETYLLDMEMGVEINFLQFQPGSNKHRFTPFIFGGVSIFKFNPKTTYNGVLYELQPLGTEGQGTTAYPDLHPYALTSWAIPVGGGIKWALSKRVNMTIEWGMRKTFTDYLDDISTSYPDISLIAAESGPLAAALSVRMYEEWAAAEGLDITFGNNGQPNNPEDFSVYLEQLDRASNSQRGDADDKDWYGIAGITFTFKIVDPRAKTCPAYKKHHNYKEYFVW